MSPLSNVSFERSSVSARWSEAGCTGKSHSSGCNGYACFPPCLHNSLLQLYADPESSPARLSPPHLCLAITPSNTTHHHHHLPNSSTTQQPRFDPSIAIRCGPKPRIRLQSTVPPDPQPRPPTAHAISPPFRSSAPLPMSLSPAA
jgi:hypothetical protein